MRRRRASATKARGLSAFARGISLGVLVTLLLAAVSLISASSASAAGPIFLVQQVASATQQSFTASNTIALTVPPGGVAQGDTLIIFAGNNRTTLGAVSATDTRGNTYTVDAQKGNASNTTSTTVLSGYVSTGLAAGDTITVTYSAVATMRMALVTEWSGIAPTTRVDRTATNTGNTAALSSGTTAATTQANELVVGSFADGANETFTAGSGFTAFPTQLVATLSGSYRTQWQEYKTVSATGTQIAPANSTAASPYAGLAVTYRARTTTDTSAPTAPANFSTPTSTASSISTSWAASSDDVGVAGYTLYRGTTAVGTTTTPSGTFTGLACGTSYTLGVDAFDAAGNRSAMTTLVAQTSACDTAAPTVSLSAPVSGTTVTGATSVTATASDNVGVAGVQFKLDGNNLQAEDTSSPYGISWDTSTAANGNHVLTAVARDAAGNTTTSAQVAVVVSNGTTTSTTPTPSPAATSQGVLVGNGFVDASARQVVRTAGNVVYVIVADDDSCQGGGSGSIHIEKGVGAQPGNPSVPTSFVEQDAAHRPISASTADCTYNAVSTVQSPDSRLDSAGTIDTVYADGQTGNVYFQTFSTRTDLWGSRVVIGTGAKVTDGGTWPRTGQVALSLDAHDVPRVVYMTSGTSNALRYTDRVSGSWSSPVTVASGTNLMHPSMVTGLDGTLYLAWLSNSLATHPDVYYSHYASGAWTTPEVVSSGDANVLSNGDSDQGPGISVSPTGTPQVIYLDGGVSASNDYVRMRYRTAAGVWADNTPPGGTGGASNPNGTWFAHTPQNYTSANGGNFVFLGHDKNIEFGYQYQLGGTGTNWGAYATLDPQRSAAPATGDTCAPGTDGSASIRFDPLRDNNPGIIDVVYFDERDDSDCSHHHARVFYKAVTIGASTGDTAAPSVSLSAPADGSTVSGNSVALSVSASDNVGVAGVQFKLDGNNLGTEDTSSPYSLTWDSTTVGGGSHTLSAVARDAAGNVTTSSVSVTVSNPDVTAPTVSMTSPSADTSVAGGTRVSLTANASDGVGVAGVQFKLDGSNLGSEITASPYAYSWDTTGVASGRHTLTAVARDAAGNTRTSAQVSVTVDNGPPIVVFTAPASGETVRGGSYLISTTASDDVGVAGVQFKLDNVNLGAETTGPFNLVWDTRTASNGTHVLSAVARDAIGNRFTATISVTVDNPPPTDTISPMVAVSNPLDGSVVTGAAVQLAASASDNVAVASVAFRVDGAAYGAARTTSPYQSSWDTTSYANGSHTVTALATDTSGNTSSSTVTVTVRNDQSPPTVKITAPADSSAVSGTVAVTANAADDIAVASVQFRLDGSNLGAAVTAPPYQVSWDSTIAPNGNHTLTAVATDTSGKQATSTGVSVSVSNASQVLIGSQIVQSRVDFTAEGQAEAFQTSATVTGTLHGINLYVSSSSTATGLIVGIYSDNGDTPGTLLTTGSISSPTSGDWNPVAVASIGLTSGTKYWVAVLGTGGTLTFTDVSGSSFRSALSAQTTLTALPAVFTAGSTFPDGNLAAYGSS